MKNRIAGFLLASSAALGLAPLAFADEAPPMHRGHGGMSRGPMMELRGLSLTQEQQDQVFKIFHEQAPAVHEQMKQMRGAHEALANVAAAETFDAARAREAADQEGRAHAQLALLQAQAMARVRALLTPEQRAKLDQQRQAHSGRGPK